jgi:hypothetical protein
MAYAILVPNGIMIMIIFAVRMLTAFYTSYPDIRSYGDPYRRNLLYLVLPEGVVRSAVSTQSLCRSSGKCLWLDWGFFACLS